MADANDAGPASDASPILDAAPPLDAGDDSDACTGPSFHGLPTASGGGHYVRQVYGTAIDDCSTGATIVSPSLVDGGNEDFGSVAVDDRVLVFTMIRYVGSSQTWELRSMPVSGGAQTTLASGSNDFPSVALYNHEAYWGERSPTDGGYTFTVRARDEAGNGAAREVMSGDGSFSGLAVGSGSVFVASLVSGNSGVTTTIVRGPASGGAGTPVATFSAFLGFLMIRDAALYWTEDTTGGFPNQVVQSSLRWQPIGAGATTTIVDANLPITRIALTDRHVYWLTTSLQSAEGSSPPPPSEWHLYSKLRAGGSAQEIASASGSGNPPELFAEGSVLEWATWGNLHFVCD